VVLFNLLEVIAVVIALDQSCHSRQKGAGYIGQRMEEPAVSNSVKSPSYKENTESNRNLGEGKRTQDLRGQCHGDPN
jgi:hypothetical protein